ncbi:Spy/CpxP family protein refolding chaperone [Flavobacteriaceae bacterium 3-367]|uniref:Spy/CpxP family protein refolding chaperone n=1 Tax=Eudoraea algarum TaxID=3417568 RepID=UPI0032838A4F
MKKNLLLFILLIFLVLMNGTLLYLFFSKAPGRPAPPHLFIVKELRFSPSQMQQYDSLQDEFESAMRPLRERTRTTKDALFNSISKERYAERAIDSLTSIIGTLAKEEDQQVARHFRAIYELCDEKQKRQFRRILKDALHGPGKNGHGPPPR